MSPEELEKYKKAKAAQPPQVEPETPVRVAPPPVRQEPVEAKPAPAKPKPVSRPTTEPVRVPIAPGKTLVVPSPVDPLEAQTPAVKLPTSKEAAAALPGAVVLPPKPAEPTKAPETFDEMMEEMRARPVRAAARSSDVRARAQEILRDKGLAAAIGFDEASPRQVIAALSETNPDRFVDERKRWLKAERDRIAASTGKKPLIDLSSGTPDEKLQAESIEKSINKQAWTEVATLKTVGLWTGKSLSPYEMDPTSVLQAMKPQAEVMGLSPEGKPVVRVQSPGSYAGDVITMPAYLAESTELPAYLAQSVWGKSPLAKEYQEGVLFDPSSIRERRTFGQVMAETQPESVAGIITAPLVGAAADVLFPDPVSIVLAPVKGVKGIVKGAQGLKVASLEKKFEKASRAVQTSFDAYNKANERLAELEDIGKDLEEILKARGELELAAQKFEAANAEASILGNAIYGARDKAREGFAGKIPDLKSTLEEGQNALEDSKNLDPSDQTEEVARVLEHQASFLEKEFKRSGKGVRDTLEDASLASMNLDDAVKAKHYRDVFGASLEDMRSVARTLSEEKGFSAKNLVGLLRKTAQGIREGSVSTSKGAAFGSLVLDSTAHASSELLAGARAQPLTPASTAQSLLYVLTDTDLERDFSRATRQAVENREAIESSVQKFRAAEDLASREPDARKASDLTQRAREKYAADLSNKIGKGGIALSQEEIASLGREFKMELSAQFRLAGLTLPDPSLNKAVEEALQDMVQGGAVEARHLASLDGVARAHARAHAVALARKNPLQAAGKAILSGDVVARVEKETLPTKAYNLVKSLFVGGDEYRDFQRGGLAKATRDWVLEATRGYEEIASDVSKLKSEAQGFRYLSVEVGNEDSNLLGKKARSVLFIRHVDLENLSLDGLVQALTGTYRDIRDVEPVAVQNAVKKAKFSLSKVREREPILSPEGVAKDIHDYLLEDLAPILPPGMNTEEAWRVTTAWVASQANDLLVTERAYGDGLLLTSEQAEAIKAVGDGTLISLEEAPSRHAVEGALGARRWLGPDAELSPTQVSVERRRLIAEQRVATPEVPSEPMSEKNQKLYAWSRQAKINEAIQRPVYLPKKVREQLTKAMDAAYKPDTTMGNQLLSWWKLSVTRGLIVSKPGYMVNNIVGDMEQTYLTFGIGVALKTALRTELGNLVPILASGGWTRPLTALAGGGPVSIGAVEFAVGTATSALLGGEKGKQFVTNLTHALASKNEEVLASVSRLLERSSFQLEVRRVLDGEGVFQVGEHFYKMEELREIAVRTGVFDSFDKAELSESVAAAAKGLIALPVEGTAHLAETISLRRRLGLYVTLIENGMAPEEAGRGVVKAMYDYRASISEGERAWLRQLVLPFWSWQKNMNRQVLGGFTSGWGAYRIKRAVSAGRVVQEWGENQDWFTGKPSMDGDDIGILDSRMNPEEKESYVAFQAYRKALEMYGDKPTPEEWNSLLGSYVAGQPASYAWAHDSRVDEFFWLVKPGAGPEKQDDVRHLENITPFVAKWVTPEMHRSYQRDFAKLRIVADKASENIEGETPSDRHARVAREANSYWYLVAPHSGIESSLQWYATMAAGLTSLVPSVGSWGQPATTDEGKGRASAVAPSATSIAREIVDPSRAPLVGPAISAATNKAPPDRIAKGIGEWLLNTGVGDGLVDVDNSKPKYPVYRVRSVPVAVLLEVVPGLNDLNRVLLANEGVGGKTFTPDVYRELVSGMGLGTATVTPEGALVEERERQYDVESLAGFEKVPSEKR